MHKIKTILLSAMFSFLLVNTSFAAQNSVTAEPEGIVLKVESQEEFDALVQDIEEGNARANKMWEAAKSREVSSSENSLLASPSITLSAYGSTNYTYTLKKNKIGLILRYDTNTSGGKKYFTDVHDFLVVPHVNTTGVSDVHWQYKYLDTKRTVAVNTSFIVSIQNYSGSYTNYDVTKYVEYYASGGANGS